VEYATFEGNDVYVGCGQKSYDAEGVLYYESNDPVSITVDEAPKGLQQRHGA
jgi:hypothetical protein